MPSCAKHRMISAVDGLNLKVEQVYTGVPLLPPPSLPGRCAQCSLRFLSRAAWLTSNLYVGCCLRAHRFIHQSPT